MTMKKHKLFYLLIVLLCCCASANAANLPVVTSEFGWRVHPISGEWSFHRGVDFGMDDGMPIYPLMDGIVIEAQWQEGYGNTVLIYHPERFCYTRYAHCASITAVAGQLITTSNIIAYVGSTGNSTGPHLHLEYIVLNEDEYEYANPLDLWR